jgi:hypothetical protein
MPKRRRIEVDPEFFREFADWQIRHRETSKRIAVALHRAEEFQRHLRKKYRLPTPSDSE